MSVQGVGGVYVGLRDLLGSINITPGRCVSVVNGSREFLDKRWPCTGPELL